jgi:hypothetical protein
MLDETVKFNGPNKGTFKITMCLEQVNDEYIINHIVKKRS